MSIGTRGLIWTIVVLAVVAIALASFYAVRASQGVSGRTTPDIGGSSAAGRSAIKRYGCGACHTIAGVRPARGRVGPPLSGVAERRYLGGHLKNTPENMTRWIQNPQAFAPGTAMPNMGVSETEARDITAYLYSLR